MWTSALIGSALCPFLFVCLFACLFRTDPTGLLGFIWEYNYVTLTFSIDMQFTLINQSTPVFRITVTAVCRLHKKGQPESIQKATSMLGEEEIMFFSLRLLTVTQAMRRPAYFSNDLGPLWKEPHLHY